jgi:hypothetical protein
MPRFPCSSSRGILLVHQSRDDIPPASGLAALPLLLNPPFNCRIYLYLYSYTNYMEALSPSCFSGFKGQTQPSLQQSFTTRTPQCEAIGKTECQGPCYVPLRPYVACCGVACRAHDYCLACMTGPRNAPRRSRGARSGMHSQLVRSDERSRRKVHHCEYIPENTINGLALENATYFARLRFQRICERGHCSGLVEKRASR